MNQRKVMKRLRKRIEVRYGIKGPELTGYSGNISGTGIMVRTTRVFGPGTTLVLELRFPKGTLVARGVVQWAREGSVQLLPTGRVGMGIRFVDPPTQLLQAMEAEGSV